jgi:hypothetical protein
VEKDAVNSHESTTMNQLPKLITQHYEKNEAGGSLLSKVTKILSGQRVATKFQQPQGLGESSLPLEYDGGFGPTAS